MQSDPAQSGNRIVRALLAPRNAMVGGVKKPLGSLLGLWSDLNIHITEEDIAEARREMWGNPRDIKRTI
jgi:hypothetical protein